MTDRYLEVDSLPARGSLLKKSLSRWGTALIITATGAGIAADPKEKTEEHLLKAAFGFISSTIARKILSRTLHFGYGSDKVIDTKPASGQNDLEVKRTAQLAIGVLGPLDAISIIASAIDKAPIVTYGLEADMAQIVLTQFNVATGKWKVIKRADMEPEQIRMPVPSMPS